MTPLRLQYLLTFAVMGSLLPYLSVYLEGRGLSRTEVGWVLSVQGLAIMVTPIAVTWLADTRLEPKRLLMAMAAGSALGLVGLAVAETFTVLLLFHAFYALAFTAIPPTQDGLFFAAAGQRPIPAGQEGAAVAEEDTPSEPTTKRTGQAGGAGGHRYHLTRVFGTVGFILPSLALFVALRQGVDLVWAVWAAVVSAGLLAVAAGWLPSVKRGSSAEPEKRERAITSLPTAEAARVLTAPRVLGFCIAFWLLNLATGAYYSFYPVYLTDTVGIDQQWIGLISNLGVATELGFMLGFGWLTQKFGLRGIAVAGAVVMGVRFGLLAGEPTAWVAVGTQLLHGPMVLAMHIVPPVYLAERAERVLGAERAAACRASIHGLFFMLVVGTSRLVANPLGGALAEAPGTGGVGVGLTGLFWACGGVTAVALGVLVWPTRKG
ncbi:MAG: MFS transporter [Planctomycetota bacterium]